MKNITVIIFIVAFLLYAFVGAFVADVVCFYKIRTHGKLNEFLIGLWWCFWPLTIIIFILYELVSIPFSVIGLYSISRVQKLIEEKRLKV